MLYGEVMKFKQFVLLQMTLTLLLTFSSVSADTSGAKGCKPSIQGPPGPTGATGNRGLRGFTGATGATGEQGPPFFNAFASAYTRTSQSIANNAPELMTFDTNTYTPQGISHIVGTSPETFTVLTAGTYLINWSLLLRVTVSTLPQDVGISATATLVSSTDPGLFSAVSAGNEFIQLISFNASTQFETTMTGSLSISLPANTTVQLQMQASSLTTVQGTITFDVFNRLFSITRIGDFVP